VLDGEVDDRLHVVGVGDVGAMERGVAAEVGGHLLALLGVDVGDDDPRAFLDEQLGGRPADPTGTPRDDRHLAGQLLAHDQVSSIHSATHVFTPWRAKTASISARSVSSIVQPTAPTSSSTSARVRQPTSDVLTPGRDVVQRSASCGRLRPYFAAIGFGSSAGATWPGRAPAPRGGRNSGATPPPLPDFARQSSGATSTPAGSVPDSRP